MLILTVLLFFNNMTLSTFDFDKKILMTGKEIEGGKE